MSSEIIVSETPIWLQELEAKREKRLKARLGHEAGAGAPCLKCGDKCPGLDLHFWRKCCKICKCTKEEHEVQDDDLYGWAQFQLLGSKPNKIRKKIVLPGKKDELELDWAPKGHNETVDKYLKTLPSELLPVKGSQAAQDRKQLLQKQIPIHDIDPTLCHELNEEELNKMNEYIAHIKQSSVGVGQIVSLSSIIKGNLHMLNPNEAAIIASRFAKGVPLSEIVMLQSQSRSEMLKQQNLSENLQKININDHTFNQSPLKYQQIYDKNHPSYMDENNQFHNDPQFANTLESSRRNPSAFVPYNTGSIINRPGDTSMITQSPNQPNYSCTLPHQGKSIPTKVTPLDQYSEMARRQDPNYVSTLPHQTKTLSKGLINHGPLSENVNAQNPLYANSAAADSLPNQFQTLNPYGQGQNTDMSNLQGHRNPNSSGTANFESPSQNISHILEGITKPSYQGQHYDDSRWQNPSYASGMKGVRNPSTSSVSMPLDPNSQGIGDQEQLTGARTAAIIDPSTGCPISPEHNSKNPQQNAHNPDNQNTIYSNILHNTGHPGDQLREAISSSLEDDMTGNVSGIKRLDNSLPNYIPGKHTVYTDKHSPTMLPKNVKDLAYSTYDPTNVDPNELKHSKDASVSLPEDPYNANQNLAKQIIHGIPKPILGDNIFLDPGLQPPNVPQPPIPGKKLSEFHPSNINVNEDYLHPSQVQIGAIQDINYPEIKAAMHGTNDFYEDYSPDSLREILNNINLPNCHYCKKPFEENEFAVTIDRANVLFHAECFRCAGCNQILADNVYFYNKETNNIYCGRDYAKVRGFPRCKACDELIFTKEYCLAENATFHLKHFCCYECDTPLAGQDYTLEDEMPYCLPCFEQSKASKCCGCDRVIKPDEIGCTLNGAHFHAVDECFACKICQKPLMGQKLLLRNQKLYCSHACFGVDK